MKTRVKQILLGSSLAATVFLAPSPASAQTADPLAAVQASVTTIGTILTAASGIAVTALGVRLGIKYVNRVSTKA
ncbi:MAG: hypothetical protein HRT68_14485 [Flavobacteriaceae bacterium]|nr:hypothetical protein [Flavobacteriaceae bacterium]